MKLTGSIKEKGNRRENKLKKENVISLNSFAYNLLIVSNLSGRLSEGGRDYLVNNTILVGWYWTGDQVADR